MCVYVFYFSLLFYLLNSNARHTTSKFTILKYIINSILL